MGNLYMPIFIIILNIISTRCYYCSGKLPRIASDCTDLSTITYQCCYIEGTSILSSYLNLKFCYGFPAGKDTSKMTSPTTSPKININVIECGTPPSNSIQLSDMCGVSSPNNSTICITYGSDCCYYNIKGNSFCLTNNSPNVIANGLEAICKSEINKLNIVNAILLIILIILI